MKPLKIFYNIFEDSLYWNFISTNVYASFASELYDKLVRPSREVATDICNHVKEEVLENEINTRTN